MHKRNLILILPFILTGCFFGEVGSGIITKECIKEDTHNDITTNEKRIIKNSENNIISVTYIDTIVNNKNDKYFKILKNSYISEAKSLNNEGVITDIDDKNKNQIVVTYEFNYDKISDELKKKYDLEELNHMQIKKYEEKGYKCK